MLDDKIEDFRRRMTPPWDHLRERRVLREVERTLRERRVVRGAPWRSLLFAVPLSLSVAALLVAYFVGVDFGKKGIAVSRIPSSEVAPAPSQISSGRPNASSEFTDARVLADGTRLELTRSARIQLRSESMMRIELSQNDGRVRYSVPPVPGRAFVIFARGVRIQVKGTVFVVDVEAGKVSVQVEQGLVRVAASSGQVDLGVGDELSTPADQDAPAAISSDSAPVPQAVRPRASRGDPSPGSSASASANAAASALLERADAERRSGDFAGASGTLHELVARYPSDLRAALAWFTLGKVERARGRAAAAAKAFETSFVLAPDGSVSEDALAEEAVAWSAADNIPASRAAAEHYLKRFPNGTHTARLQHLLE